MILLLEDTSKTTAEWRGPYSVEKVITSVTYQVATAERRKRSRIFHVKSMKRWIPPNIQAVVMAKEEEGAEEQLQLELPELDPVPGQLPEMGDQLNDQQWRDLQIVLKEFEDIFSN